MRLNALPRNLEISTFTHLPCSFWLATLQQLVENVTWHFYSWTKSAGDLWSERRVFFISKYCKLFPLLSSPGTLKFCGVKRDCRRDGRNQKKAGCSWEGGMREREYSILCIKISPFLPQTQYTYLLKENRKRHAQLRNYS
jgi:hypothetical protein